MKHVMGAFIILFLLCGGASAQDVAQHPDAEATPLSEKRSFMDEEYGALFWSMETYPNVWRFKTDVVFRDIKVVLTGPDGLEKILIENKSLQGFVPLDLTFYLGEAILNKNGQEIVVTAPYGFTRSGQRPFAESSWLQLKGEKIKKVFVNKIISSKDVLDVSGNIILATIQTENSSGLFDYSIQLQVQAQGSYFLKYAYDNKDGKLIPYLSNGEAKFFTTASLKEWVASLAEGTKLALLGTCMRQGNEPLIDSKELEDFKDFCRTHHIDFIIHRAG